MLLTFLLSLFSPAAADTCLLGHDDFDTRQRANARLVTAREWALPALLTGTVGPDLEQRIRSRLLLSRLATRHEDALAVATAAWLFYGPSEGVFNTRFLTDNNTRWVGSLHPDFQVKLVGCARRWGLLKPDEKVPVEGEYNSYSAFGWVNVMRFRARRLPDPAGSEGVFRW